MHVTTRILFAWIIAFGMLKANQYEKPKNIMARKYFTLNYPSSIPGGKTLLTGIRQVTHYSNKYYISGFYKSPDEKLVIPFVYNGRLSGDGTWNILNYPSSEGKTVLETNLYGPNNGLKNNIQVVGNYTTKETGKSTIGCLYEGPLDGSGKWTTIIPNLNEPVLNTIAHSTMGGLVVGNYNTQVDLGKAFIYDIKQKKYYEIIKQNAKNITGYGIWQNDHDFYTICGGYSDLNAISGLGSGYLVDWDNKNKKLSNWRSFNYNNDPINSIVTHFDGITSDGHGGYNLTGDWIGVNDGPELGFFAQINGEIAKWAPISFPHHKVTSGNSVSKEIVIGVYLSVEDKTVNGYVSIP